MKSAQKQSLMSGWSMPNRTVLLCVMLHSMSYLNDMWQWIEIYHHCKCIKKSFSHLIHPGYVWYKQHFGFDTHLLTVYMNWVEKEKNYTLIYREFDQMIIFTHMIRCFHNINFIIYVIIDILLAWFDGILPKGPNPSCSRMADRALLAGYPRYHCVRSISI